jgi:hypothetical protein
MLINKSKFLKTSVIVCMLLTTTLFIATGPLLSQPIEHINAIKTSSLVTKNDAEQVVSVFIIHYQKQYTYSIDSCEPLYDTEQTQLLGYIYHLQPTGYIVITSSQILPPVVAYSWNKPFPNQTDDLLRQFMILDLSTQLNNKDLFPQEVLSERLSKWDMATDPQMVATMLYEQWPAEGTTETEGWIETTWHQDAPYNDMCPIDPDTDERSVVGCPAVAMAQIFNYYKTTKNIQFTDEDDYYHNYLDRYWIDNDYEKYDFPSFPELNTYLNTVEDHFDQIESQPLTDQDLAALNFACGVACKQVYSPAVSGTFGVDQAYDAYLRFNCTTAQLFMEETEELHTMIIDDMQHARPVHLAVVTQPPVTAGHNLIIDGYNTEGYYHLNFGWGGLHDTWYQVPLDLPYELTAIEGVIVNIMNTETAEDLSCEGNIQLRDVTPGDEIQASFTLSNMGEPGSMLSWKILSVPGWGTWTITPYSGTGLTPEQGDITIEVSITAPTKKNKEYLGGIAVENVNNPGDREYIPIVLQTAKKPNLLSYDFNSVIEYLLLRWQISL